MMLICLRHAGFGLVYLILATLWVPSAYSKNIGIAFIEDGSDEPGPTIAALIVQELGPLLPPGDVISPVLLKANPQDADVKRLLATAVGDSGVSYVVATGYLGSQQIYQLKRFPKPTYLLRVLDPALVGAKPRSRVRNLRSYSLENQVVGVFKRVKSLFRARTVGIVLPLAGPRARRSIDKKLNSAAKNVGITTRFIRLDYGRDLEGQIQGIDALILPPVAVSDQNERRLFGVLNRLKIPSYAVGGDRLVFAGALISDSVAEDDRVLARRVALDLQLAIAGEARTQGFRRLQSKKRTTINIDTARAIGIDLSMNEVLSARVVQGSNTSAPLGFLSALSLATDRNLDLQSQNEQLRIDTEKLEQARSRRRPQFAAQLDHSRNGTAMPTRSSTGSLSWSQAIYSPSANGEVDVARLGLQASELSFKQKGIDVIRQAASAYFEALQAQAQFETSLRDLTLNRENLSLAQQRKRSGSVAGSEIYRWQAVIASSETAVLRAYTTNSAAQRQLAQLLNTRLNVPVALVDVDLDQPPFDLIHEALTPYLQSTRKADWLTDVSAKRTISQSYELKSAAINESISDSQLKTLNRSYYLPEVSLAAQAYQLSSNATSGSQGDWALGLTAKLPIWQGGARSSQQRQIAAQKSQANAQLQNLRIGLWASSGNAVNDLVANLRAIELSKRAEQAARKSQQITQRAYKLGAASVTELLDTQNEFREAQDNADIARFQYLTALVNFQALMGEMPMLRSGPEQEQWIAEFMANMQEKVKQ